MAVAASRRPETRPGARPGGGPGTKPPTKGEQTRARLIDAALAVFGEVGFDRASVSEITRRAVVSQGTFYLYFPSKTAIFSELVRQIGRDVRRRIQEAVVAADGRLEAERRGFAAFFEYIRDHPHIYRIVRQAEFVDREAFGDYYRSFASGYVEGLSSAAVRGEIRDLDPEVVAWALMGMGDLLGVRWILLGEDGKVPDRVLDTVMSLIERGLVVEPGTAQRRSRGRVARTAASGNGARKK